MCFVDAAMQSCITHEALSTSICNTSQMAANAGTQKLAVGFGAEPEAELLASGAPYCAANWPDLVSRIEESLQLVNAD